MWYDCIFKMVVWCKVNLEGYVKFLKYCNDCRRRIKVKEKWIEYESGSEMKKRGLDIDLNELFFLEEE